MYRISFSGRFKKSYKLCIKRGLNPDLMSKALRSLSETGTVPQELLPHPLHGEYGMPSSTRLASRLGKI